MRMYMILRLLSVCVAIILSQNVVFAQTEPASSYTFNSLTSGVRQVAPNSYKVDDFLFSFANQNIGDVDVVAKLTTANGSNYQFSNQNFTNPPTLTCVTPAATYTYATRTLHRWGTDALNVLNVSVPATTTEFTGSLTVETTGHESFYMSSPTTFSVSSVNAYSTICDAYYDAWQNLSVGVPWYWDGNAQALISPYANNWHNHAFWDKGWNSALTVTNNGSQSVQYTINYKSVRNFGADAPLSFDPSSSCSATTLNQSTIQTVGVGSTWSGSLNGILNPNSSHSVQEDGFFFITLSPVISGTAPTHYVNPNSTGTATVCGQFSGGGSCPVITSCQ